MGYISGRYHKMDKEMACKPEPKSLISGLKQFSHVLVILIVKGRGPLLMPKCWGKSK